MSRSRAPSLSSTPAAPPAHRSFRHQDALLAQNRKLILDALGKPIGDVLPPPEALRAVVAAARKITLPEASADAEFVAAIYETAALDETLGELLSADPASVVDDPAADEGSVADELRGLLLVREGAELDLGPETRAALVRTAESFLRSPDGQAALVSLLKAALPATSDE